MNEKFIIKIQMAFLFFLLVIASFMELLSSIITQYIVDNVNFMYGSFLLKIFIMFFAYLTFQFVLLIVLRNIKTKYIYNFMVLYKNNLFGKMLHKNPIDVSSINSSNYISSLTNDLSIIQERYVLGRLDIFFYSFLLVGSLVLMIRYNNKLTIFTVVTSVLSFLVFSLASSHIEKAEKIASDENTHYVALIKDIVLGFQDIIIFKGEKYVEKKHHDLNKEVEESKRKSLSLRELVVIIGTTFGAISQVGSIILGCILVTNKQMSIGQLMAFIQLTTMWILPLQEMPRAVGDVNSAKVLVKKHNDLFESDETQNLIADSEDVSSVQLCNLSYRIDDRVILDDINFTFENNKKYAIIGKSGSGKSTLLRIISGVDNNYSGKVVVKNNNTTISNYLFPLMKQEVFLFDDTIVNNILLGKTVDKDDLEKILNIAKIKELIDKRGLNALCGENGNYLSGGERQRISLARCLLKAKSIILLDEATSAVDEKTEMEILKTITGIEDIMCISIIHTNEKKILSMFDTIIYVDNGKIKKYGKYDEIKESIDIH